MSEESLQMTPVKHLRVIRDNAAQIVNNLDAVISEVEELSKELATAQRMEGDLRADLLRVQRLLDDIPNLPERWEKRVGAELNSKGVDGISFREFRTVREEMNMGLEP